MAAPQRRGQETGRGKRLLWAAPCGLGTAQCSALKALQGPKALGDHSARAPLIPPELLLLLRLLALHGVHWECTTQRVTSTAHQSLQQLGRVLRGLQLGGLKGDLAGTPLQRHAQGSRPLLQAERPAEPGLHRQGLTLAHLDWAGLLAQQHNTAEHHGSTWCTHTLSQLSG